MKSRRSKLIHIALACFIIAAVAVMAAGIRVDYLDFDVNTGKTRYRSYLFCIIPIRSEVRTNEFSDLVEEFSLAQGTPDWRLASSSRRTLFSTTRRGYRYGHAIGACAQFCVPFSKHDYSSDEKKRAVAEALKSLSAGDIEGVERLASALMSEPDRE